MTPISRICREFCQISRRVDNYNSLTGKGIFDISKKMKFEKKPITEEEIKEKKRREEENFFSDIVQAFQEKASIKVVAKNRQIETVEPPTEGVRRFSKEELRELPRETKVFGVGEGEKGKVTYANSLMMVKLGRSDREKTSGREKTEPKKKDYLRIEWENGLTLTYHNPSAQGHEFTLGVMKDEEGKEHIFILKGSWKENFDFEIIPVEDPHQLKF